MLLDIHICSFYIYTRVKLVVVSYSEERNSSEVSQIPRFATSRCGGARYLLRLHWASRNKLSKSIESYLLLVEVGSKSSEWESEKKQEVLTGSDIDAEQGNQPYSLVWNLTNRLLNLVKTASFMQILVLFWIEMP